MVLLFSTLQAGHPPTKNIVSVGLGVTITVVAEGPIEPYVCEPI